MGLWGLGPEPLQALQATQSGSIRRSSLHHYAVVFACLYTLLHISEVVTSHAC